MHKTSGLRDPAAASSLPHTRDDSQDRRQANRAVVAAALARQLPERSRHFFGRARDLLPGKGGPGWPLVCGRVHFLPPMPGSGTSVPEADEFTISSSLT
jgi:hypothetical protein